MRYHAVPIIGATSSEFCLRVLAAAVAVGVLVAAPRAQSPAPLRMVASIPLPRVGGRIDHLAFDSARRRLFVAALGNDTVEVVDTAASAHLRSLAGFHEPQGLAVVSDLDAVAVANGDSGTLQLIDAQTYQTRWIVNAGSDADNVRYDAAAKRIFVAAVGGLVAVDAAAGRVLQRIAISGHPESFQLELHGPRVFANLPGESLIVAGDRSVMRVMTRWMTGQCRANYPMALDEAGHRLFIGCRSPASVAIVDTANGNLIGLMPAVGDTDDLFYDSERRRLYVIGGEGAVDVFARDADRLRRLARVPTRQGARTGLWIALQRRLYVAVPASGGRPAEIRVFEAQD
jgi:DNA-binding beta-propeller fold protein YncE